MEPMETGTLLDPWSFGWAPLGPALQFRSSALMGLDSVAVWKFKRMKRRPPTVAAWSNRIFVASLYKVGVTDVLRSPEMMIIDA